MTVVTSSMAATPMNDEEEITKSTQAATAITSKTRDEVIVQEEERNQISCPQHEKQQRQQQNELINTSDKSGSSSIHTIETTTSTIIVTSSSHSEDDDIEVQQDLSTTEVSKTSITSTSTVLPCGTDQSENDNEKQSCWCFNSKNNNYVVATWFINFLKFMQRHMKKIGLLLFIGMIIYVIVDCSSSRYILGSIQSLTEWMKKYPIGGSFAFTGVIVIGTIILLPGAILVFGVGFVFSCTFGLGKGMVYGTICVFLGSVIGSVISFVIARYLCRQQVKRLCDKYEKFNCLDKALQRKGLHIMILLRLSPLIPYNVVNYLMGITSVSLKDYTIALIGLLPGIILLLFFGASAGSITDATMNSSSGRPSTTQIITYVLGSVFGIVAVVASTYYARKELHKEAAASEATQEEEEEAEQEYDDEEKDEEKEEQETVQEQEFCDDFQENGSSNHEKENVSAVSLI